MAHVRSVAVGVWLTRGSRHEPADNAGIAHFVEHMLFKGTPGRSAEEIAQQVDSIGGQIDAFTSKEYAGYYLKVLDEHLPLAVDILADLICNPLFADEDIEREKKVILEEIKMVEDTPDDLVHEIFAEGFWSNHPLGRPILGTPASVNALDQATLRRYFADTYVAANFVVVAVGNLEHGRVQELLERALENAPHNGSAASQSAPPGSTGRGPRRSALSPNAGSWPVALDEWARQQREKIRLVADHAGNLASRVARTGKQIAPRRTDDGRTGILRDHQPAERLPLKRSELRRMNEERRAEGVKQSVNGH